MYHVLKWCPDINLGKNRKTKRYEIDRQAGRKKHGQTDRHTYMCKCINVLKLCHGIEKEKERERERERITHTHSYTYIVCVCVWYVCVWYMHKCYKQYPKDKDKERSTQRHVYKYMFVCVCVHTFEHIHRNICICLKNSCIWMKCTSIL